MKTTAETFNIQHSMPNGGLATTPNIEHRTSNAEGANTVSLAKMHALIAEAWRESAAYWRGLAQQGAAEMDWRLALWAGENAAERERWAAEDGERAAQYLTQEALG